MNLGAVQEMGQRLITSTQIWVPAQKKLCPFFASVSGQNLASAGRETAPGTLPENVNLRKNVNGLTSDMQVGSVKLVLG